MRAWGDWLAHWKPHSHLLQLYRIIYSYKPKHKLVNPQNLYPESAKLAVVVINKQKTIHSGCKHNLCGTDPPHCGTENISIFINKEYLLNYSSSTCFIPWYS